MEENKTNQGLIFILVIIALILDAIEILETVLSFGLVGFILFFIATPINLIFYTLIFFSGLWAKVKSNKKLIGTFLVGLIGENIPGIEVLPLNTLNIILIALEERKGVTNMEMSENKETSKILRTAQILRKAKLRTIVSIIVMLSFCLPLISTAQYYDYQNYPIFPNQSDIINLDLDKSQTIQGFSINQTTQNDVYVSVKKINGGLMIGIEPMIFENGEQLSSDDFIYYIGVPEIFSGARRTLRNIVTFYTNEIPQNISVNITLESYSSGKEYQFIKYITLPKPKVVIANIDPETNLISPLHSNSRFMIALPYNFSSNQLQYFWSVDDEIISENPVIETPDADSVVIEVINKSNTTERALKIISQP